jgi:hypothetical protein
MGTSKKWKAIKEKFKNKIKIKEKLENMVGKNASEEPRSGKISQGGDGLTKEVERKNGFFRI